jgi:FAD/FMN-containing dehydrogenase
MRLFFIFINLIFVCFYLTATNNTNSRADFSGYYQVDSPRIAVPKTVDDVKKIVNQAREKKQSIAIAGTQFSQGGHTLPVKQGDILLYTKALNRVSIFPEEKIARVGPGASWRDVQEAANNYGLAVKVMQASNVFSVGGSISTNVHGWDYLEGTLANTVLSLTIVNPSGSIQKAFPGDELFSLIVGGYGMFGIIVEVEISLTENSTLERYGVKIPTGEYLKYFQDHIQNDSKVQLHYARLSLNPENLFENVLSVNYSTTDKYYNAPKTLPREPTNGYWYERLAVNYLKENPHLINLKEYYDNYTFLKPTLMTRNEAMTPSVRFVDNTNKENIDILQEFFLPVSNFDAFLAELKTLILDYDINVFNATIRHVKKDNISFLPYATTDVIAIVLFYNETTSPARWLEIENFTLDSVQKALQFQGTYYLPYHRFPSLQQFEEAYPEHVDFFEKKREFDPDCIFISQFAQHYFPGDMNE